MCCCPRAGSFCEIFGALTLRFMVDITVSCFLCTRVSEKLRMCMAPFLTPSPRDTNLHESFGLLNFSSLFLLLSSCGLLGYFKMSHSVLKCNLMWAGCYQHVSVKCNNFGRANISKTSFDLEFDA